MTYNYEFFLNSATFYLLKSKIWAKEAKFVDHISILQTGVVIVIAITNYVISITFWVIVNGS